MKLEIEICDYRIIIDECDLERVTRKNWSVNNKSGHPVFQTRIVCDGKPKRINLARFILDPPPNLLAVQANLDRPLDYSRDALKVMDMAHRQSRLRKTKQSKTSRFKGVSLCKKSGLWRVGIRPFGNSIYIGAYPCEREAAKAYNDAARKYFGDHAYQNDLFDSEDFPQPIAS